jgi:ribonuclease T2
LVQGLDTYKALADAGITPSYDRTYDADEIQAALSSISGGAVILRCRRGALNQAWYSFNVKGSVQNGRFVGVEPAGSGHGSCPRRGIRYLPKK